MSAKSSCPRLPSVSPHKSAVPTSRAVTRRQLFRTSSLLLGGAAFGATANRLWAQGAPAVITPDRLRPGIPYGVQSGEVSGHDAVVWSRSDRPTRLWVEVATNESFRDARRVMGPAAIAETDFTARINLTDLPEGQEIYYRVLFQDLADPKIWSAPAMGRFKTPPTGKKNITFAWSGDEAGQGWGINPGWGGMKLYEMMRRANPDFFIHSGDQIYADGPIPAEIKLDDGTIWKNLTTPEKSKVAETLAEYRGAFAYNFLDEHKRRFCAEVPMLVQWDDHETRNNWYPGQVLGDARYTQKSATLLSAYAKRAMFEYNAMRYDAVDPERIYRAIPYGRSLEVFMLDERTYRGPNTPNQQKTLNEESAFLGSDQLRWIKQALKASKATWKVIASDMPISIVVPDLNSDVPKGTYEAWANEENGAPSGRELELVNLLGFIKENKIKNVVWLTADVHYAQATYYNPSKAKFSDFTPFWEFVAGPINAGTFGPGAIDTSFGPEVKYTSVPEGMKQNRPPTENKQYYGVVKIDGATEAMTVTLHDILGVQLYKQTIDPQA